MSGDALFTAYPTPPEQWQRSWADAMILALMNADVERTNAAPRITLGAATITSGPGAPADNSPPIGSLYLRTDGGAASTLLREDGCRDLDREVIVREATPLDAGDIMRLLIEMHGDNHSVGGKLTTETVNTGFGAVAYSITLGHAFVACTDDERIVGTIGALLESDWWSREPFLADKWWYVVPEHRRSGAGAALMRALCARADGLDLPLRSYWLGTVERGEALQRMMRPLGFRQVGCIFTRVQ